MWHFYTFLRKHKVQFFTQRRCVAWRRRALRLSRPFQGRQGGGRRRWGGSGRLLAKELGSDPEENFWKAPWFGKTLTVFYLIFIVLLWQYVNVNTFMMFLSVDLDELMMICHNSASKLPGTWPTPRDLGMLCGGDKVCTKFGYTSHDQSLMNMLRWKCQHENVLNPSKPKMW